MGYSEAFEKPLRTAWPAMTNPVSYYPDTDTMYVEIRPGETAGGRDAGEDLVIHYGSDGAVMGYEIEHASRHPEHIAAALTLLQQADQQAA